MSLPCRKNEIIFCSFPSKQKRQLKIGNQNSTNAILALIDRLNSFSDYFQQIQPKFQGKCVLKTGSPFQYQSNDDNGFIGTRFSCKCRTSCLTIFNLGWCQCRVDQILLKARYGAKPELTVTHFLWRPTCFLKSLLYMISIQSHFFMDQIL